MNEEKGVPAEFRHCQAVIAAACGAVAPLIPGKASLSTEIHHCIAAAAPMYSVLQRATRTIINLIVIVMFILASVPPYLVAVQPLVTVVRIGSRWDRRRAAAAGTNDFLGALETSMMKYEKPPLNMIMRLMTGKIVYDRGRLIGHPGKYERWLSGASTGPVGIGYYNRPDELILACRT
ncbi:hypothetical protein PIB30_046623 [Stylosanthes scabra]|uniref:Uncharacterized protein n=1 Tax=Stylosanthes scabra TaxID=79078 RepID=A0ABU6UHV0_9FABA|nr:hypothetical protein [Stylosanthes scabra]